MPLLGRDVSQASRRPSPAADDTAGQSVHRPAGARSDISTGAPAILLPPAAPARVLRWLPWGVGAYAVLVSATLWHALGEDYGAGPWAAGLCALAFAAAMVLCLWRATAGWWLSLAAAVTGALGADDATLESAWPAPVVVAHVSVLALRGLRSRPRALAEMWLVTLAAGLVLTVLIERAEPDGLFNMSLLSGVVLTVIGMARMRGEAADGAARQRRDGGPAEEAERVLREERARIARELHDVVAHHMSVIAVQAEAAPYRAPNLPPELTRSLSVIRSGAIEALTELHRILGLLRDDGGDPPRPSVDRVDRLVARVAETGVPASLQVHGTPVPVAAATGEAAYRIVQEALSNAIRHAPGAPVRVALSYLPGVLEVRVDNDRAPLPPAGGPRSPAPGPEPRAGHGLAGMRERAALLGGTLEAGPRPDGGYTVLARLPLRDADG
jgi:signal transduction histidine kinase|nr:MAG: two-component sensor histidine kinase [Actinomycetota bacterium]